MGESDPRTYTSFQHHIAGQSPFDFRIFPVGQLLQQIDQGTQILFLRLFLYTMDMPAILLTNICSAVGHVNGARGTASGIVIDSAGLPSYSSILDT